MALISGLTHPLLCRSGTALGAFSLKSRRWSDLTLRVAAKSPLFPQPSTDKSDAGREALDMVEEEGAVHWGVFSLVTGTMLISP